jgi:hypothetical protein
MLLLKTYLLAAITSCRATPTYISPLVLIIFNAIFLHLSSAYDTTANPELLSSDVVCLAALPDFVIFTDILNGMLNTL